jgi:outer membrane autotransporter protein
MKYGAVAVGTRVSGTCIWNAIKYRDQRSMTTAKRCRLAGDSDLCRSLRSRLLSSVSLAVLVTTVAAFEAGLSPALAQTCTPDPSVFVSGNATCTAGAYSSNINYDTTATNSPINLTLDPGVIVNSPGGNAVNAANTTGTTASGADIAINANGTAANPIIINNTANPGGNNQSGLRIQSSGSASITATNTTISVNGTQSDNGIWAIVLPNTTPTPHAASVTWSGPSITSIGANSTGIQADNRGVGDAAIVASGNISGSVGTPSGFTFLGLDATAADTNSTVLGGRRDISGVAPAGIAGNASVTYNSGTINVQGNFAAGIFASANAGSATITALAGTNIIVSQQFSSDILQPGVDAFSSSGAATAAVASTILINGSPTVPTTNYKSNPTGIRATSDLGTAAAVTYSGPGITVHGGGGLGIVAVTGNGSATVSASGGPIIADGSNAIGILADSGTIRNQAQGRPVETTTDAVQVTASNVSTLGQFGTAISATGGSGGVTVTIPSGGSIMGGWQADVTSVGSTYGLPAAGVILGSSVGTATLTNDGTIGALSDRAVASSPLFPSNNTSIINNGTITGFVQLVGSNNSIVNNGTFNLRHFADTNGDGTRDTLRVAVTDLGPGTFTNNGMLALLGGPGATTLDATGQYLPLGLTFNAMALGGPVQGQILGAKTFTNSGIIDLQANPVAGDVLLISGGHTPGANGGGTFISNGGQLLLDTVLNEGGANSRSDVLVVDGTSLGVGGATKMSILNAGGAGALTVGDGILVVQVLDPNRSAPGVFALAGEVRGGAFDYDLFHGGVSGSNPSDWFLRSTFIVGPPIVVPPEPPILPPEPPPQPAPPGVNSIIGPEIATYGVVQPIARQMGLTTLGTYHERVGDAAADAACLSAPPDDGLITKAPPNDGLITKAPPVPYENCWQAVWGRVFGQQIDNHYEAFADPRANGQVAGIQAGADLWRGSLIPGHSDVAGIYFAYGNGNVSVDGLVTNPAATAYILEHTGSVNLNAYSVGGYWTHRGPTGWYIDAVLQGSFYSGNAATQFANLPTNGTGFTSSLEVGYPIPLPVLGPGFVLEPEGQIIWQRVSFDQDNDGLGPVGLGTTSGASGRLGLRSKWTINDSAGRVWQPYVLANVWRDWGADATTMFGSDPVPLLEKATRLEFAGGLSAKILPGLSLYAQAGYQFAVSGTDGGTRDGVRGDLGVHYTW